MSESGQGAAVQVKESDWAGLDGRTKSYSFVQCAANEEDAIFCGLRLKTSEIAEQISRALGGPGKQIPFLFVFADTLTVDSFTLPSSSTTIVARSIRLEKDDPLLAGGDGVVSVVILTQAAEGGQLRIKTARANDVWPPALSGKEPKVITFVDGKTPERDVSSDPQMVLDLLRHPMAWNSLRAEFAAAVILLERNDSKSAQLAMVMLKWIYECTGLIAKESGPFQMEANDLNYQSASLMVQAGAPRGATYVPVLSKDFYEERVKRLLAVVESHERKLGELETLTFIGDVVQNFGAALKDISAANVKAIDATFDNATEELRSLRGQYNRLLYELFLQKMEVEGAELAFKNALELKKFWDQVQAVIAVASALISFAGGISALSSMGKEVDETAELLKGISKKLGVDITDKKAVGNQISNNVKTLSSRISALASGGLTKLADAARSLQELQTAVEALADAAFKFQELYDASNRAVVEFKGGSGPEIALPDWEKIGAMDPDMEWNMYMAEMEAQLAPYEDLAGEYKASLVAYTEYAKALNRKAIAMVRVHGRIFEILAQKKAAEKAVERWGQMEAEAKNEGQKKAAMRSLLGQQLTNAKRSLLVSARDYRAAYLYRWLSEPTVSVNLEMNHQQLTSEFAKITQDVEKLLSAGRPPQTFDTGVMSIPVVRSGGQPQENTKKGIYAVLDTIDNKQTLTWSIPISGPPFEGKLPPSNRLAVFVEEGWFHLAGAKANPQGSVIVTVITSGEYANGYGKAPRSRQLFACKPLEMDFIYSLEDGGGFKEPPNTPWRPAREVRASYMVPSPFTQFTLTVEGAGSLNDLSAILLRFRGVYHKVS